MTDYCTVTDVQNMLIGWQITDTSEPSKTTVEQDIIPRVSQYIDDRLARYYVTPITGTNSLTTVKRVAQWLAAAEVAERAYTGQEPADSPQATTWRQLAERDLTAIVNGQIILYDAGQTPDSPTSWSHLIKDSLSGPYAPKPLFKVGKRF